MAHGFSRLDIVRGLTKRNGMVLHTHYRPEDDSNPRVAVAGTEAQFYKFVLDLSWEGPEQLLMDEAPERAETRHGSKFFVWHWSECTTQDLAEGDPNA